MLDLGQLAQRQAQAQAKAEFLVVNTAINLYGTHVDPGMDPQQLRTVAAWAVKTAPFLAEAFGLFKVQEVSDEND